MATTAASPPPAAASQEEQQPDLSKTITPRVDWLENPEYHVFMLEMPGVTKEDLKITMEDEKTIQVFGVRREMKKEGEYWHLAERPQGTYYRRINLPENADSSRVKAQLADGVLTLMVPKKEAPKPRNIEVHA